MHSGEKQYLQLLKEVKVCGTDSPDRTGTGTRSLFTRTARYDLTEGFPLFTSKNVYWKGVLIELLWIMRGDTNVKWLHDHNVNIWNEWADEAGNLGPVYGATWRNWKAAEIVDTEYSELGITGRDFKSIDQLSNLIEGLKTNPESRRHILSAWNVGDLDKMRLPPCHSFIGFYVRNNKLSCHLTQRSGDMFLGVPFNVASYSALTHLIANECGMEVGEFCHTILDCHIYHNHFDAVDEQLSRQVPKDLAKLEINLKPGELMDFIDVQVASMSWEQIKEKISLQNYKPLGKIKAEVSV